MNKFSKIGVFDSGIGGLNVLSDLVDNFPNEDFLYLGDNLNVPYGVKTKEELEKVIRKVFDFFIKEDVKCIMVACNTASSASSDMVVNKKVFRIIEPTAKRALMVSNNIAVVATNYTISSHAYEKYLGNKMVGIKASPLVMIAEDGSKDSKESKKIINDILSPYKGKVDSVILACTHFPLLEKEIKEGLGVEKVIDSSKSFSPLLREFLDNNDLNNEKSHKGQIKVCFTKEDKLNISWFNKEYDGIHFINI